MIAYSRPFWPLFLHVLGAMTLVGAMLVVVTVSIAARRRPELSVLRRSALVTLLAVAIPSYVVMRICAQWIYSKEGSWPNNPTWIGIGFAVADFGLLVLLATTGCAYWWVRSARAAAGGVVAGLASVYLVLLALAWLAMSGKWG